MSLFAFVKQKPTSVLTLPDIFLCYPQKNILSNFFPVVHAEGMDQQEVRK